MKKHGPSLKTPKAYGIDEQIAYVKRLRRVKSAHVKVRMALSIEQTLLAAKWVVYCQMNKSGDTI
jgi:hypothetical protein